MRECRPGAASPGRVAARSRARRRSSPRCRPDDVAQEPSPPGRARRRAHEVGPQVRLTARRGRGASSRTTAPSASSQWNVDAEAVGGRHLEPTDGLAVLEDVGRAGADERVARRRPGAEAGHVGAQRPALARAALERSSFSASRLPLVDGRIHVPATATRSSIAASGGRRRDARRGARGRRRSRPRAAATASAGRRGGERRRGGQARCGETATMVASRSNRPPREVAGLR